MPRDTITILHLSDPQFGKNHVFGKRALPLADGKHDTLLARTCDDLDVLRKEWDLTPEIVVLTGDLAEWGVPEEFKNCFDFLAGIGKHLSISPEQRNRIAVIAGNHDMNRNLAEAECAEWRANGKKGEPFGFRRFEFFAKAFTDFYKKVPKQNFKVSDSFSVEVKPAFNKKQPYGLFVIPEFQVVFAGMNSTLAECHFEIAEAKTQLGENTIYGHHGYCGEDQYRHFAKLLEPFEVAEWLRVGLVHHNFTRGATTDNENLTDADQLNRYLGRNLNLLLHGHTHIASRALLSDGQPILSTGSAALGSAQRPNETPNQYQVLKISSDGIEVWMRSFDHHSRRWIPDGRVGGEKNLGRLSIPYQFSKTSTILRTSENRPPEVEARAESAAPRVVVKTLTQQARDILEKHREREEEPDFEPIENATLRIAELRWPGGKFDWHRTTPPYLSVVVNETFGYRPFAVGLIMSPIRVAAQIAEFDSQTGTANCIRWLVAAPSVTLFEPAREPLPAWYDWKSDCSARGIRLLSWREYERMSDLRIAIENQKKELLTSRDTPKNCMSISEWSYTRPPRRARTLTNCNP